MAGSPSIRMCTKNGDIELGATQEYNWQEFMARWSRDMLASKRFADGFELLRSEYPGQYTNDVLASGWLGYPPATDAQIEATERRLGLTLPPDYKAFLETTNGWRVVSHFINRIWPVEEIDWLTNTNPDSITNWNLGVEWGSKGVDAAILEGNPLHESQYLASTLQISDTEYHGTAVYLLNPMVVSPSGEWEAWFFAHWNPGAQLYPSFWEMMQSEYNTFLYVEASQSKPR